MFLSIVVMAVALGAYGQKAKVYDESINPDVQIVEAVSKAQREGKLLLHK